MAGLFATVRWAANREPYLFAAGIACVVGCVMPAVIPKWRRARGYDTYIIDGTLDNPYLNDYHESKRNEPTFNDSRTIAAFLKKHPDPYRN